MSLTNLSFSEESVLRETAHRSVHICDVDAMDADYGEKIEALVLADPDEVLRSCGIPEAKWEAARQFYAVRINEEIAEFGAAV